MEYINPKMKPIKVFRDFIWNNTLNRILFIGLLILWPLNILLLYIGFK